jgi:Protein of unknown function (DUF2971)
MPLKNRKKPTKPIALKRYTSLAVAADVLTKQQIALVSPSLWHDENDKFLLERYRERENLSFVGAVCLTTGPETFHHWKTFADGPNGVCIEFDKEELERYVAPHSGVRIKQIQYLKIDQIQTADCDKISDLPFLKRSGFSDEREYRIIFGGEAEEGFYPVPIDLSCIRAIKLSPFVPDGLSGSIKDMLRSIDGCSRLKITRSRLTDSSSWKKKWNRRLNDQFGKLT